LKNVLFIDNYVKDLETFVNSVNIFTFPIIYSRNSTKKEILELLQTKFTSIERIAIVFISSLDNTKLFIDNQPFFIEEEHTFSPYSENVEFLLSILKEFQVKNIDFLACNTLNFPNWNKYYKILTQETGVVVGASNDLTGNLKYGF
jgi:hypothetical protein